MTEICRRRIRATWRVSALAVSLAVAGCGDGMYPVRGKVLWNDGTPATELVGGVVSFESVEADLSARGEIGADATFALSSLRKDDGLPPGTYSVLVAPSDPEPSEDKSSPRVLGRRMLPARYRNYSTSGLQIAVEARKNEITLTVDKQKR